ncbi:glycosyltransferase [Mycobacterium nebraskense]|uniref:Glycosyl transferase family 1 n=1 Tax=Mycobacterium nebraskense TaxID=244292 RepID=A0A0F5NI33_9MYCO|nr:glycosyl transferase family 1 [Mycobacterium nebraskense]KLO42365.1 glycosyl transferase family 1 [Mycobacterium nebraskense]ORW26017.1 glycosyl transferase family 1 [Mycobacterium nebraskense]
MSALATFPFSTDSVAAQQFSGSPSFGLLSTYPPTPCGLATFSAALAHGLVATGADVRVVRVSDGPPSSSVRVIGELVEGSPASVAACAELLNESDVAVIQHDYGIYGGVDGDEVVGLIDELRVPSIVVAHTILKDPTRHQRSVLEAIAARADQVIVMSDAASERLLCGFDIDRHKVATIPHGATIPTTSCIRGGRPTLLTWGLLGPGKGIERVIDAMGSLHDLPGQPRYVVAGRTRPKVLAADSEAYRDALIEQARQGGVERSVCFDGHYRNVPMLTALVQSAAVVVLPYDSTDQATSGVLVEAVANGRPVVATAFPHAVELLASGAGIVVPHDDPDALVSALRRVLTQPRLAGAMAAEARRMAPEMAWPVVADAYVRVAHRLLTRRRAGTRTG